MMASIEKTRSSFAFPQKVERAAGEVYFPVNLAISPWAAFLSCPGGRALLCRFVRKQAKDSDAVLRPDVHFSVCDHRSDELVAIAEVVAPIGRLVRVVE